MQAIGATASSAVACVEFICADPSARRTNPPIKPWHQYERKFRIAPSVVEVSGKLGSCSPETLIYVKRPERCLRLHVTAYLRPEALTAVMQQIGSDRRKSGHSWRTLETALLTQNGHEACSAAIEGSVLDHLVGTTE